ncbi:DUF3168 domain-containing protein [Rickettsiales bacterium]|nr:DUF3168 domain-containing protein [Rickettsiales bacterium]
MANFIFELQKAIFTALSADGTLSSMISGVYTHVPQDTAYPYVVIGETNSVQIPTNTTDRRQISINIIAYSKERGSKEAIDIQNEIKRLLHRQTLAMTGCSMGGMQKVNENIIQEKNGVSWKASSLYQIWVE